MSIQLPRKPVTLAGHANCRTQKHGEELHPMMDLKLSMLLTEKQTISVAGESLIVEAWFKREDGKLAEPLLKDWAPYRKNCKYEDCVVIVTVGVNAKEIDLGNCSIKNLVFKPQDRGASVLTCTVQCELNSKTVEVLLWMGHEIDAKLQFGEVKESEKQDELDLASPSDDVDADEDGDLEDSSPRLGIEDDGDEARPH